MEDILQRFQKSEVALIVLTALSKKEILELTISSAWVIEDKAIIGVEQIENKRAVFFGVKEYLVKQHLVKQGREGIRLEIGKSMTGHWG